MPTIEAKAAGATLQNNKSNEKNRVNRNQYSACRPIGARVHVRHQAGVFKLASCGLACTLKNLLIQLIFYLCLLTLSIFLQCRWASHIVANVSIERYIA